MGIVGPTSFMNAIKSCFTFDFLPRERIPAGDDIGLGERRVLGTQKGHKFEKGGNADLPLLGEGVSLCERMEHPGRNLQSAARGIDDRYGPVASTGRALDLQFVTGIGVERIVNGSPRTYGVIACFAFIPTPTLSVPSGFSILTACSMKIPRSTSRPPSFSFEKRSLGPSRNASS